ncbi:unnamed protein product [Eruca vesicaria subsp. sativa]|uniref:RING-type domain-containing protein n=1 Tax=Eruca vesicaria subsp. sativa TaxID=29727 RepID=A0ABC8KUG2_ERUVS|nr:unnamed protein product [Eruca vesicaria subsp. sativa]
MGFSYGGTGIIIVGVILNDFMRAVCSFLDPTRLFGVYSWGSLNNIPMDDMLPATKFKDMSRVNPPESCRICQDEFDGGDQVRCLRNCVHVFHKTCIDRWIHDDKMTCPLCRTPIIPDFYFLRLTSDLQSRISDTCKEQGKYGDKTVLQTRVEGKRWYSHSDRIIRRDGKPKSWSSNGGRNASEPYYRSERVEWREKSRDRNAWEEISDRHVVSSEQTRKKTIDRSACGDHAPDETGSYCSPRDEISDRRVVVSHEQTQKMSTDRTSRGDITSSSSPMFCSYDQTKAIAIGEASFDP